MISGPELLVFWLSNLMKLLLENGVVLCLFLLAFQSTTG